MGEYSDYEHLTLAQSARSAGLEQVILVGKEFKDAAEKEAMLFFENTSQLKSWFLQQNFQNSHFLIKGSRSIGLEKLLLDDNAH
jgi:UDP-N-acetylmuramoyl-tripeptide--D-alanyl-D-alanine ligase